MELSTGRERAKATRASHRLSCAQHQLSLELQQHLETMSSLLSSGAILGTLVHGIEKMNLLRLFGQSGLEFPD